MDRAQLLGTPQDPTRAARPYCGYETGQTRIITQGKTVQFQAVQQAEEWGGSYTIALGITSKPTAAQKAALGIVDAPIDCLLTYGLGGATQQNVLIDWLEGTLLTVPTGGFQVSANYPTIVGSKDWTFELSSMVSPGPRPPSAGEVPMARRTLRLAAIPAGVDSPRITIPPRGHAAFLLLPDALAFGNLQINWSTDASGFAANVIARTRPGGSEENPIPNGARNFTVTNFLGVAIAPLVVFSLAL